MRRAVIALAALMLAVPATVRAQAKTQTDYCYDCGSDPMRVLLIGAHPDDEDTNLIAWLQKGGRAETAYLSLTRGDGGQNLIGNELGEQLGIIRTEELLAARRVDGAHQFFTRAYDFGFSKSADETYAHWPKDSLLNDVVTVVRSWRPHVIILMFTGTPRDGHGHHQVSALLGKEAYAVAGDTVRFPVRDFGPAWTPLKLYQTARFQPDSATIRFNVGEYNRDLRKSYAEIAGESRSQHKSQGFGALQRKGVVWNYVTRIATRVNEATAAKSEKTLFDGVVPSRVDITDYGDTREFLNHVALEAIADRQYIALGDSARVSVTFYNRSRKSLTVSPGATSGEGVSGSGPMQVAPDSTASWVVWVKGTTLTQPWWLATPRNGDLFSPAIPRLRNPQQWYSTPEDQRDRSGWIHATMDPGGGVHLYETSAPAVFRLVDPVRGDIQRPLAVVPAVSVTLDHATELGRAKVAVNRFVNVTLRSAMMTSQPVRVSLTLPRGLTADSVSRTVTVDSAGTRRVTFRVRGSLTAGDHLITASASVQGATFASGYVPIDYDHITPRRLYRPAQLRLRAVDVTVPERTNIAYIHGVGDNVAESLQQLGIPVTVIQPLEIPVVDLSKFTAVVIGPRAYEANRELVDNNNYLLDYARNGGTLVVQYGQYEMTRPGMMPYPITIARPHDRVTEEVAPITILDAASAAFRSPNAISPADFNGWVQERSLYMPRTFNEHYHALVELSDPGAPPSRGGILVTPYGRGLYVYTTLAFFRQLPAGVSGATRLFANLISMKAPTSGPSQ